jgi:hypothetical protein
VVFRSPPGYRHSRLCRHEVDAVARRRGSGPWITGRVRRFSCRSSPTQPSWLATDRFPEIIDRDWLGRITHLSSADIGLALRRADPVTRLGYATQLVTVRAIGTFLPDPAAVPEQVAAAIAGQLGIDDPGVLAVYRDMPVRWRHTVEIRQAYGYRDFTAQPGRFAFLMWLYRQVWADEMALSALFRAAHRQLLARQILLPGQSVLMRLIATVRERATGRVHSRLAAAAPPELAARLEKLLLVPEGQRRSELDLLRRPPFTPTITGLVRALERLDGFVPSAPGTWTCPASLPRGSWPWPGMPTRPGPPSWPTLKASGGSLP